MIQRLLNWLRGQIAYYVMRAGTLALNKSLGLSVTTTSHLDDLYQKAYEFAYAVHQQQRAEAELEELTIRALIDRLYLASLLGATIDWTVLWTEGEPFFTLQIRDDNPVEYPQTLENVDTVLKGIHDILALSLKESEVH